MHIHLTLAALVAGLSLGSAGAGAMTPFDPAAHATRPTASQGSSQPTLVAATGRRTPRNPATQSPSATAPSATTPSPAAPDAAGAAVTPSVTGLDGGRRNTLKDCIALWDKGTHMSKPEWRATCRRNKGLEGL